MTGICKSTEEFSLASKEVKRLERQGFGYFQCIQAAMRLVVSQGFSEEYAQKVAEETWDLVCG